jgi:hypothetical protein
LLGKPSFQNDHPIFGEAKLSVLVSLHLLGEPSDDTFEVEPVFARRGCRNLGFELDCFGVLQFSHR